MTIPWTISWAPACRRGRFRGAPITSRPFLRGCAGRRAPASSGRSHCSLALSWLAFQVPGCASLPESCERRDVPWNRLFKNTDDENQAYWEQAEQVAWSWQTVQTCCCLFSETEIYWGQVRDCWKKQGCESKKRTCELYYFYQWLKCLLCSPLSGLVILLFGPCGIAGIEGGRLSRVAPSHGPTSGAEWGHRLWGTRPTGETQCSGEETWPYGFIQGSSWRKVQIHHLYRLIILPLNNCSLKHW